MHKNYFIRKAGEEDLPAVYHFICQLEETVLDETLFATIFARNFAGGNCCYLIAESLEDGPVGFISCHVQWLLHHAAQVAEVQELFVVETWRRAGVARDLVDTAAMQLKAAGCILLETTAQNKRVQAHLFYQKAGFTNTHKKFVRILH